MKKTYKILIVLVIMIAITIGGYCIFNISMAEENKNTSNVDKQSEEKQVPQINGIKISDSYTKVQEKLGTPEYTDYAEGKEESSSINCYFDNGKTVASFNRKSEEDEYILTILTTSNPDYEATNKIKIGMQKDEIINIFSKDNLRITQEQEDEIEEIEIKFNNSDNSENIAKLILSIDTKTNEVQSIIIIKN